jgi:hypothetical protein
MMALTERPRLIASPQEVEVGGRMADQGLQHVSRHPARLAFCDTLDVLSADRMW